MFSTFWTCWSNGACIYKTTKSLLRLQKATGIQMFQSTKYILEPNCCIEWKIETIAIGIFNMGDVWTKHWSQIFTDVWVRVHFKSFVKEHNNLLLEVELGIQHNFKCVHFLRLCAHYQQCCSPCFWLQHSATEYIKYLIISYGINDLHLSCVRIVQYWMLKRCCILQ